MILGSEGGFCCRSRISNSNLSSFWRGRARWTWLLLHVAVRRRFGKRFERRFERLVKDGLKVGSISGLFTFRPCLFASELRHENLLHIAAVRTPSQFFSVFPLGFSKAGFRYTSWFRSRLENHIDFLCLFILRLRLTASNQDAEFSLQIAPARELIRVGVYGFLYFCYTSSVRAFFRDLWGIWGKLVFGIFRFLSRCSFLYVIWVLKEKEFVEADKILN